MCVLKKFTKIPESKGWIVTVTVTVACNCTKKRGYEWFPGNFTECFKDVFIHDFSIKIEKLVSKAAKKEDIWEVATNTMLVFMLLILKKLLPF